MGDLKKQDKLQLCLIIVTSIFLALTIFTVVDKYFISQRINAVVPKVINDFLLDYRDNNWHIDDTLAAKYFLNGGDSETTSYLDAEFESIFCGFLEYRQEPKDLRIDSVNASVVEITMLDGAGNALYPKVLFTYKLTNGKAFIRELSLSRLQPFSRYDSEFNEAWN